MKDLIWIGDSLEKIKSFPEPAKDEIGFALYLAQCGEKHSKAKPLKGFKDAVFEIAIRQNKDAYRTVYVLNIGDQIYVLAAFMKKSTKGKQTQKHIINLLKKRLIAAKNLTAKKDRK